MSGSTVTAKGQITIPARIRDEFGIAAGDEIVFLKGLDGQLKVHVLKRRPGAGRGGLGGTGKVDVSRAEIGEAVADGVASRLKSAGRKEVRSK
jgi:AbrB family looped-hinge helix DNA binding protein